ncbi:3-hydroxyacyl-CoA dehydrogenase NAD-binding domain-containing protein [Brevirhabdus sp.]|uniref:3-hydroxyacyl-CoA dehydrogenase NAD-binding domain-containing protein n=1 Tax=Brevirhabdus sp. TaxID=2004514 RepID=UPI004057DC2E
MTDQPEAGPGSGPESGPESGPGSGLEPGPVTWRRDGTLGIVTINNPPVNAIGQAVRLGLMQVLERAAADTDLTGLVLCCAGRTFVAGADITELGQRLDPTLPQVIARLEALPFPTVAAIHGTALGGGLELALGCTFRVAAPGARLGLPEVKLGLLPGAGGTVRATYLIGARAALDLIGTGNPLPADAARNLGLIDAVAGAQDAPTRAACDHLRRHNAQGAISPPVLHRKDAMPPPDMAAFGDHARKLLRKARSAAPVAVVEAIRNALVLPPVEALARERALFQAALESPVSAARRHLFFAERKAARLPRDIRDAARGDTHPGALPGPRPEARHLARAGVVGAGLMGSGIAMALADAGFDVTLREVSQEALQKGLARIARSYDKDVARGRLSAPQARTRRLRIVGTTDLAALSECDLIIEAAFEDLAVKQDIFRDLDRIARPGAILATNTSYLDLDAIAAVTARPADVVGLHFFSPAQRMTLLEVVRGARTAPDVLASALALARRMGKQPVIVGAARGFVGNRMLAARNAPLARLLLEGATPAAVDAAFRDFGWPMGPFEMQDMAGLDISWRNRKATGQAEPLADALCEAGHFGQKTGRGWYRYEDGARTPLPDPHVTRLSRTLAARRGVAPRALEAAEIIARTHGPLVDEGRAILREGIAARASDIDVIWTHGYGFPGDLGGPMYWARTQGLIDDG